MSVVVFGSVNMDLVAKTSRLPSPGETILGQTFATVPGGKGANQAVAVARLGVMTEMVGRIGSDEFGQSLLKSLQDSQVGCDRLLFDPSAHSGVAMIAVDAAAENHIIVIPGANGKVGVEDVDRLQNLWPTAKVLLLQLEIPLEAVIAAAQAARRAGVTVVLDPAPARSNLPAELYACVDILTPNRVEASQLVGFAVKDEQSATEAANLLLQRGIKVVIVKLGSSGVLCATPEETFLVPAFSVDALDTVAAGDAFNGGLAAGLAEGLLLRQAVTQGAAVAALSVTKPGAQSSLPYRRELEQSGLL